jgi:hypothetical protein
MSSLLNEIALCYSVFFAEKNAEDEQQQSLERSSSFLTAGFGSFEPFSSDHNGDIKHRR